MARTAGFVVKSQNLFCMPYKIPAKVIHMRFLNNRFILYIFGLFWGIYSKYNAFFGPNAIYNVI